MSERGPVGRAGELTALELAQRVINNFRQYAANGVLLHPVHYLPMAEELESALAAKAPQGVPLSLVSQLKDYVWQLREVGNYRCTQTANDIERMLEGGKP